MDRRDFFKAAGVAGLSIVSPWGLTRARASQPYSGRFFVMVNAGGGWDPTSLCDPKGRANEEEADPMNMYFSADIGQAGNIRYAPVPGMQAFFDKYYSRLLVINGIDTQTNGHDSGSRNTWSGRLAEGHPAFSAIAAATLGADRPLAFMSFGGYDLTRGLIAPTRTGNTGVLTRIAYPSRVDPNNPDILYNSGETLERIRAAQSARMSTSLAKETLSTKKHAISSLMMARAGENDIKRLTEFLPTLDGSNNALRRQSQLAIASYKAGVCVSANLNVGGFDTHGNHDANHLPRLNALLEGVDFLMDEAERQGVADKIVVVVGSDFGRTPGYNGTMGKDHWSITSMMLMGEGIAGNRVIGATDPRHRPLTVNATSLALDASGIRIQPSHVHRALRDLAGITGTELDRAYPIVGGALPLFTA